MSFYNAAYDLIAPFEGAVPHLYKCTKGVITWGVGFTGTLQDARRLVWSPPRDLETDWVAMRLLPAGRLPSFYRSRTSARLSEGAMRQEFHERLVVFERQVERILGPAWRTHPDDVRLAVLDMAYNMGAGFLPKWPHFTAALKARDYATCARECRRKDVQTARNDATRALFEKCSM